ncbi:MAG: AsmA-like C-terminal region-containing protein [Bryobacterales bacterium]|nr:AsmA-like C-terminal region-containing protein [Bryobacterales bacterium]
MGESSRGFWRRRWWQVLLGVVAILVAASWIAARVLASRIEPYARERFIAYLEERFNAIVEIGELQASLPINDPYKFLVSRGRGSRLNLSAKDVKVSQVGLEDLPPLLQWKALKVSVDFPSLFEDTVYVKHVSISDFRFTVPPKGRRPSLTKKRSPAPVAGQDQQQGSAQQTPRVILEEIVADGMNLTVLSSNPSKAPLEFDLRRLRLFGATPGEPLRYEADLTNPKPPGVVHSKGTFGPYVTGEPGDSPLNGSFSFEKADLSVFKGIRGILHSTGTFSGQLNQIVADGIAETPEFGLSYSKNTVKLVTKYHAIIDGTNGNTELRPVEATIGSTRLVCDGAVERFPGENGKTVALKVSGRDGDLRDILLLAMKDTQIPLRGRMSLNIDLRVPPGAAPYADRLQVSGQFKLHDGQFTNKETQEKLNEMSSRALGRPTEPVTEDVTTDFDGNFRLQDRVVHLSRLRFFIPGAAINLNGSFNLASDELDFHGKLRTDAKLSQMMKTRWKRWALKPVDPFFSKGGAGAQFNIAITGTRENPKFGLDR